MVDIYDLILQGIKNEEKLDDEGLKIRLEQLKPDVRTLRNAYRSYPVSVAYNKVDIQAAYLITYFPHYYQLVYKILVEDHRDIFINQSKVKLVFFGGGPGPEIYGVLKYIVNNRPDVKNVEVYLFDLNAKKWLYSHNILCKFILPQIINSSITTTFSFVDCNLASPLINEDFQSLLSDCNLLVFQNCLNEIPISSKKQLLDNIKLLFRLLPDEGSLLLSDLTGGHSGVITLMQTIEKEIGSKNDITVLHSTVDYPNSETIQSVHHTPSRLIREHLLDGQDGLIPRKWLKYNYSLVVKALKRKVKETTPDNGLQLLYSPLNFTNKDANDYLNSKTFVGIDFGTSTTVVSLARVHDKKIITETVQIAQKNESGWSAFKPLINSAVALKDDRLFFGCYAYDIRAELTQGVDVWHSFKMELGKGNYENFPNSELFDHPSFKINGSIDAVTQFFKYLGAQIELFIETSGYSVDIEYAVSIPASFQEKERIELLNCLQDAGIVVGNNPFIDEPIAAVVNYVNEIDEVEFFSDTKKIMVIDIGAGTCDVSIIEIGRKLTGAYSRNLAISRYGRIGGRYLDEMIAERILWVQLSNQHSSLSRLNEIDKKSILKTLTELAERLKIKLCRSINVYQNENYRLNATALSPCIVKLSNDEIKLTSEKSFSFKAPSITYKEFYDLMLEYTDLNGIEKLNSNTLNFSIQSALDKSGLKKSDISHVLATGGGSRNPYLIALIADAFTSSKIIIPDNIQEHVSKGTAIHSLVLNTFGVNLIQPILSNDIILRNGDKEITLFKAGSEIPTDDYIMDIVSYSEDQDVIELPIFSDNSKSPLKVFSFECITGLKYQVHFFVNPEKWLECEVLENRKEIKMDIAYPLHLSNQNTFLVKNCNILA